MIDPETLKVDLKGMDTARLLREIETLQGIQRRNHPDTEASRDAGAALAPRFAEMSRRQKLAVNAGKPESEWKA